MGAYGLSFSPYGTFDQGGNVEEWNEQIKADAVVPGVRGRRGGSAGSEVSHLTASDPGFGGPGGEYGYFGFRVATLVPEPAELLLVLTGGLLLTAVRRRRV